jgi:hypothetical protein
MNLVSQSELQRQKECFCGSKKETSIKSVEHHSQISQVLWEITEDFCPRIIGTDGRILCVSTIGHSHFIVNKLWLPSGTKLVSSKSIDGNNSVKSVVIENLSKLERIESKAFKKTRVRLITIPDSVESLR